MGASHLRGWRSLWLALPLVLLTIVMATNHKVLATGDPVTMIRRCRIV